MMSDWRAERMIRCRATMSCVDTKKAEKTGIPMPMSSDIVESRTMMPPSVEAKPVPSARRVARRASPMPSATRSSLEIMIDVTIGTFT